MSVKRRVNWISQQRVDLPDLRSIESAASADFDTLFQSLITGTSQGYVLRGFEISMANAIGGAATSLQMIVDPGALIHIAASQSGTFLLVEPGTNAESLNAAINTTVTGSFTPNALNYIGIDYTRTIDPTTNAQVYIWDPTSDSETNKIAPRAQILNYQIFITSTPWAANVLPICTVTTDAGNNVVSIEDNRNDFFRLGQGGLSPNPLYTYPWTDQTEGRTESPFISTSDNVNPFHGGDKMLGDLKSWADAIMSRIKEISGSAFWYTNGSTLVSGLNLTDLFFDTDSSVITMRGQFVHSGSTPGLLSWSGQINIRSIIGELTYVIPSGSVQLADGQVAYISLVREENFQPANTFSFTNGSATVTAVEQITGIVAGDWILFYADSMAQWAQVQSITNSVGNFYITLTSNYTGSTASGAALRAQGSYTMQVADPDAVPASANTYWIAKRDDNGLITATIAASPTGAVRSSDITTFTTTFPQALTPGTDVIVAGVTDTSFNGEFTILTTPTTSSFTVQNSGPDASSGGGTVASVAVIYLRGIGAVSQNETLATPESAIQNILQYIGSNSATDTQPQYSSNYYVPQGLDLTGAIGKLDLNLFITQTNEDEDRSLKLVRGGTWALASSGGVLSWNADANIQLPSFAESSNRIAAGSATLVNDGDCAYVELNRVNSAQTLSVTVANIASVPLDHNVFIFARNTGGNVLIGRSFLLLPGESKLLDAGMSIQNAELIGGTIDPITEATSTTNYSTRGAPNRTIFDSDSILDAQANNDIEIDKFFGQLRLKQAVSANTTVKITSSDVTMRTGETRSQKVASFILDFPGAVIDFATGDVYESDGSTPLGWDFDPVVPAAGTYRWFAIQVVPSAVVSPANMMSGQVLVIPASASGSSPSTAPKANFERASLLGNEIPLGQVCITSADGVNITAIVQSNIVQLSSDSNQSDADENVIIDLMDATYTTLPTLTSQLVDGTAVTDGMEVLFTTLASGNNRIYQAKVVGGSSSPALPNNLQMAISNANPYAGGNVETVIGGSATAEPNNDSYFQVDGSSATATIAQSTSGIFAYVPVNSTSTVLAQPIIAGMNGSITQVTFTGLSYTGGSPSGLIDVSIWSASAPGGVPAVQLSSTQTIDASTLTGTPINLSFAPISVVSGAQYFIYMDFSNVTSFGADIVIDSQELTTSTTPPGLLTSSDGGSSFTGYGGYQYNLEYTASGTGPVTVAVNTSIDTEDTVSVNTQSIGQTFTASASTTVTDIIFQLRLQNSTPALSGNLYCKLYTDNTGQPGTLLATSNAVPANSLSASFANYSFTFGAPPSVASSNVYHAIIDTSGLPGTDVPGTITWTLQPVFSTPYDPVAGDEVRVNSGVSFATHTARFDGTQFVVNNVVRHFNENNVDFFEQDAIATTTLTADSSNNVFTVPSMGSENIVIEYSLKRDNIKAAGVLVVTTNNLNAYVSDTNRVSSSDIGVTFFATVSGGYLNVGYSADNSGPDITMKFGMRRWSDEPGGPNSIPQDLLNSEFSGGYVNSAFNMSNSPSIGYQMSAPYNVAGYTRIDLVGWTYLNGLNGGSTVGDLEVLVNGQVIPRQIIGVTTDDYFTEVDNTTIQFWTDLTISPVSIEIRKRQGTVDAGSQTFVRVAEFYDAIVGSAAQVATGGANYTTLTAACANAIPGQKILVLQGTYAENVEVAKNVFIEGKGHGCTFTGTFTVDTGSDYSTIKGLRIDGGLVVNCNGTFIKECFQSAGNTITDTGTANDLSIIQES